MLAGTIWIDPRDGRVLRTALVLDQLPDVVRARLQVDFEPFTAAGVLVPKVMTEEYDYRGSASPGHLPWSAADTTQQTERIECRATYDNYRRFVTDGRVVGMR